MILNSIVQDRKEKGGHQTDDDFCVQTFLFGGNGAGEIDLKRRHEQATANFSQKRSKLEVDAKKPLQHEQKVQKTEDIPIMLRSYNVPKENKNIKKHPTSKQSWYLV